MTYDYELGQSDLIPDSGAPCEAEPAMCDECNKDLAEVDGMCFDCRGEFMCDELGLQERLAA
jgi:hypothetical protein